MKLFNHIPGQHIYIDDAKIYVEEIGNSSHEPLLFLHSGFGNMKDFNAIIPLLKKEYRRYASI